MSHHRGELEELAAFLAAQGRIPAPPGSDVYGYSGDFR
jgi:hypothetical protein